MGGYLYALAIAGVWIALIGVLLPAQAQAQIKLLCSLCVVCLVCTPLAQAIGALCAGDWELPDAWTTQAEPTPPDYGQSAQSLLAGQLQLALEQEFGLDAQLCRIYAEWNDRAQLTQVTLVLSGKAIWQDPDPIKAYVERQLGCKCTVVLE